MEEEYSLFQDAMVLADSIASDAYGAEGAAFRVRDRQIERLESELEALNFVMGHMSDLASTLSSERDRYRKLHDESVRVRQGLSDVIQVWQGVPADIMEYVFKSGLVTPDVLAGVAYPLFDEMASLLAEGKKVRAIDELYKRTKLGFKTCKDWVETWMQ